MNTGKNMVRGLLFKRELAVNPNISLNVPTVEEILNHEEDYYGILSLMTATPYDMMVQLDEMGVDFCTIDDYQLFLLLFDSIKQKNSGIMFKNLLLSDFSPMVNPNDGAMVLCHKEKKIVIDKLVHFEIVTALRQMHRLKRNNAMPGNDAAKKFLLRRNKEKMKRRMAKGEEDSKLEGLIVALVNTEQFSYGYEGVKGLTIYQFNESVQQIVKKIDYDNRMRGVYSGTLDAKNLRSEDLNWLTHK